MKKVLFLIGGAVLLFLFSFYCSYSIYKNSRGCNDTTKGQSNIEEYIWTIDRTDSEETTDAVDRVETVETISKKENSETEEAAEKDYHFLMLRFLQKREAYMNLPTFGWINWKII